MVFLRRCTADAPLAGHRGAGAAPLPLAGLFTILLAVGGFGCSECEVDYDCSGTRICADGVCEAYVCRRDEDCPPGNSCAENACRENPAQPAPDAPDTVVIGPGR